MKDKILGLINRFRDAVRPYKKNIIIPLLKIIAIIILCAILVRVMGGHETLADYARKNPEIAYPSVSTDAATEQVPEE